MKLDSLEREREVSVCVKKEREGGGERETERIILSFVQITMTCHVINSYVSNLFIFLYKQQIHTCVGIERETAKVRARKWKQPMDACHVARRCGSYHNPFRKETLEMNS